MGLSIGYFGVPGRTGGLTHIVEGPSVFSLKGSKAICGQMFHPDAEYQWCYPDSTWMPECEKCKKKKQKL